MRSSSELQNLVRVATVSCGIYQICAEFVKFCRGKLQALIIGQMHNNTSKHLDFTPSWYSFSCNGFLGSQTRTTLWLILTASINIFNGPDVIERCHGNMKPVHCLVTLLTTAANGSQRK